HMNRRGDCLSQTSAALRAKHWFLPSSSPLMDDDGPSFETKRASDSAGSGDVQDRSKPAERQHLLPGPAPAQYASVADKQPRMKLPARVWKIRPEVVVPNDEQHTGMVVCSLGFFPGLPFLLVLALFVLDRT